MGVGNELFLHIDGLNIHYHVSGQGDDLILLHGWGASMKSFEPVHMHLQHQFRTYSIDLPGFGESESPPVPWGIEQYSNWLSQFIDALQIHNPILIGHSFGGKLSIHYASAHPTNKLVLVNSAGIKPKRKLPYYFKVYTYKLVKRMVTIPGLRVYSKTIIQKMKARAGSIDYRAATGVMQQTLVIAVNEDVRHLLTAVKVPALLIWGDRDTATPVSDGQLMEKLIPNAGLVVLKNAGHYSYLDKLREFLIILDSYLAS